ncbi:hypothetical protein ABKV19_008541 [Rosa sericea]
MIMVFKILLFLFFAILLVTTKVLADEFENENAKKSKVSNPGDVQTPPLSINKVYDDEKINLTKIYYWMPRIFPRPKPKPTPKVPPPSEKAPPPPILEEDEDDVGETPAPPTQDHNLLDPTPSVDAPPPSPLTNAPTNVPTIKPGHEILQPRSPNFARPKSPITSKTESVHGCMQDDML